MKPSYKQVSENFDIRPKSVDFTIQICLTLKIENFNRSQKNQFTESFWPFFRTDRLLGASKLELLL